MEAPKPQGQALLAALERGDRLALAEVTKLITGFLMRLGAYDLRDHWDDLIQESLVALLRASRRGSLSDERALVSYTGSIIRNKLSDHFRRRGRPGDPDPLGDPEAAAGLGDPREPGSRHPDLLLDLDRAFRELPNHERRVIEAIYIQGHSYAEASSLLRLPLGTLKRYQSSGLKQLRRQMGIASAMERRTAEAR